MFLKLFFLVFVGGPEANLTFAFHNLIWILKGLEELLEILVFLIKISCTGLALKLTIGQYLGNFEFRKAISIWFGCTFLSSLLLIAVFWWYDAGNSHRAEEFAAISLSMSLAAYFFPQSLGILFVHSIIQTNIIFHPLYDIRKSLLKISIFNGRSTLFPPLDQFQKLCPRMSAIHNIFLRFSKPTQNKKKLSSSWFKSYFFLQNALRVDRKSLFLPHPRFESSIELVFSQIKGRGLLIRDSLIEDIREVDKSWKAAPIRSFRERNKNISEQQWFDWRD